MITIMGLVLSGRVASLHSTSVDIGCNWQNKQKVKDSTQSLLMVYIKLFESSGFHFISVSLFFD